MLFSAGLVGIRHISFSPGGRIKSLFVAAKNMKWFLSARLAVPTILTILKWTQASFICHLLQLNSKEFSLKPPIRAVWPPFGNYGLTINELFLFVPQHKHLMERWSLNGATVSGASCRKHRRCIPNFEAKIQLEFHYHFPHAKLVLLFDLNVFSFSVSSKLWNETFGH